MSDPLAEIVLESANWETVKIHQLAERSVAAVLAHFGAEPKGYLVSILGCNDERISILNKEFRGKAQPTNVLSWPVEDVEIPGLPPAGSTEDPTELGDIAIAFETCEREAKEQNKRFSDHVVHLLVHATLHLLGYDHEEDKEAELMEATETAILASIGITDPYE